MNDIITFCKCGKRCFSFRKAHEIINDAKKSKHFKKIPKRVYYCKICKTYHITSISRYIPFNNESEDFDY